eukprot:TRINITY_DN9999_c0_g1_i1.p1 TRINITY_DN9999_c0_g1~~TRINITY_DN9999_c0_g1_i1.p1  ORF type:complete len:472 (-),score=181.96 TRINITY_DN9999_c0_g1_i1:145-1560(-)
MSLTSDEVNFLVYRYLQESGFVHSAFCFFNESTIPRSNINGSNVPHGALVNFLQRGLLYSEMEAHITEEGSEVKCSNRYSPVAPHVCSIISDSGDLGNSMSDDDTISIEKSNIAELKGHQKELFTCSWGSKLATGSADGSVRLWGLDEIKTSTSTTLADLSDYFNRSCSVLSHESKTLENSRTDITSVDWNPTGSLLASGSFDGAARIWTEAGELKQTLAKHSCPVVSLRFSKNGALLLTGSMDSTAIVWNTDSGELVQQFAFHKDPILDVDWRDNSTFATSSKDMTIYVCQIEKKHPIHTFKGHADEINCIRWSPDGNVLASCSDDLTIKVWGMDSESSLFDLKDHSKEVSIVRWSPTGPGSPNPNKKLILASASVDNTIRLWDTDTYKCKHVLDRHQSPINTIAFSPDGDLLASGGFDQFIYIWSTQNGELIKSFKADGFVHDICWDRSGQRVAATLSSKTAIVIDVRK